MKSLPEQLTELKSLPTPADLYAREHETYNEDNVKHSILAGRGTKTIASRYQVSEAFVIKCRNELHREGRI